MKDIGIELCGQYTLKSQGPLPLFGMMNMVSYAFFVYLQVKSCTLFDSIITTDDPVFAMTFVDETWGKHEVCFPVIDLFVNHNGGPTYTDNVKL